MDHSHWGLCESPHGCQPDPCHFYQSPRHEEALARVHFLVEHGRRLGLLLGPSGTGKSMLLEVLGRQLRRAGVAVAKVNLTGVERRELLWEIAAGWGANPGDKHGELFGLSRCVNDFLVEARFQQQGCVLLGDNADEAAPESMVELVRLAQTDAHADSRFTLILSARPERFARLDGRLIDLASLRIDLAPWDRQETSGYLDTALAQAGGQQAAFDKRALERLHELAQGVPRRIRQLAELALLAGAGDGLNQINPETVETACHELAVPIRPARSA